MEIDIHVKVKIRPEYVPLLYIVAGKMDCKGDNILEQLIDKLEERELKDKKSLVVNSLYAHFGESQVDVANEAINLLDDAVTVEVKINENEN